MISQTTIEAVNELTILEVVEKYVPDLKKQSSSYIAKSPFTDEKSPSFYVVPKKNIYKCFSTGKGGGPVSFVMELKSLTYPQAIEEICNTLSIRIEYDRQGQTQEQIDELELLYKINHATARRYAEQLQSVGDDHPAKAELIGKRKFTPDTISQWQIGYAPGEVGDAYTPKKWDFLTSTIIKNGYYKQATDLRLIKTKDSVTYDTFRNRIIYPILDHHGRFVGFGGRALKTDSFNAKYINSDEGVIFHKSKILFGLFYAKEAIRTRGYANLMEGYTDVISFHQAGENNSIATCGTALTEDQAKLLKRYTSHVVMFNDPDKAGQDATERSIDVLMKSGFQTSVVPMPSIINLKPESPTPEDPLPELRREQVFIKHRTKASIIVKSDEDEEREIMLDEVESIEKIDPDELVRLF